MIVEQPHNPPLYLQQQTMRKAMMASDDHDDVSSVESDFDDESGSGSGGGGILITMDDMSVSSQDFPRGRFGNKSGSFVSVLSTESSIEADLAPPAPQRQGTHNATWNNGSSSNPQERYITVPVVPDSVPQEGTSRKSSLRRNDAMSGSCGSIKEHLHFGAINEDTAYDSLGSSDEESGDEAPVPRNFGDIHTLRNKMKVDYGDESSEAESSVDDSVIKNILSKTDSRERIIGTGTRSSRTRHRPSSGTRKHKSDQVPGATGDPLLNRFLDTRRDKGSSSGNHKDPMIDSIMGKTDSLNHVNQQGQRVVKTRKDLRTGHDSSSRPSSIGAKDPLMERFLATKATQRQNHDVAKAGMNITVNSCDSLQRVDGKGQRLVGTRLGC